MAWLLTWVLSGSLFIPTGESVGTAGEIQGSSSEKAKNEEVEKNFGDGKKSTES